MSEYWQKRFEMLENARNKTAMGTVQSVTPAFDLAQAQIEKEINAWYARFAKNNQIDLLEAKKLLNSKELKEFHWDVQEYIKYGRQNAIDQKWMKELENASARFHISRLEALKIRTQNAAERAFGNELDEIDDMAARIYTDSYYHTAYEIQRGLGIGWDVGQIDQKKVDKLVSKPWTTDRMTFSDRIWKSKTQLIDAVHTELTQMCVLGKAPDQAIDNLAKRMNVSKHQAGRLVMTESTYFGSVAQKDCFNDLDVEKYEIVATLDSHTSEVCRKMDGQVFDMKDFEAGVTAPPFHVWCRSCTAPWFEDNDNGTRAARGEDGNTYQVPASMKYDDWKKTFVDGGFKDGLKPVVTIEDLQKQLADKKHERASLKNQLDKVNFTYNDWKVGYDKPSYQKFDSMSDDEYQKYINNLKKQDEKLNAELHKIQDDLDYYYDRPDRGTPEREVWDKWKKDNNIDLTDLNDRYYAKYDEVKTVQKEIDESIEFNKWKSKYGFKTKQDFLDEINDLTNQEQKLQEEIKKLEDEISDAQSDKILGSFKKIVGDHSIEDDLTKVNPNYKTDKIWQINCQRCCPTYELRRRGYDVTVLPYTNNTDPVYKGWQNIFKDAKWEAVKRSRGNLVKEAIIERMKTFGDGARGEIYVQWKQGSAHVFMCENVNGVIRFIDGQTGESDVSNYFEYIKPTKTLFCRLDELKVTDLIEGCCK
jgi:SPP1 gp7 family putative phage head morphogenesis protein